MGLLCCRWEKPTLLSLLACREAREVERGRERSLTASLEASTGFDESFFGGYLEERGFLGRSGCEAELQFAEHVIEQEDQLSRTQQHLLLPLHSARRESFIVIEY